MNMDSILKYIENNTPNESLSIKEQVEFEYENLGYINMTYDVDKRMCYVLDVDTKYRPKVTLYCLNNAKQVDCKIYKEVFDKYLLKKGDIIVDFDGEAVKSTAYFKPSIPSSLPLGNLLNSSRSFSTSAGLNRSAGSRVTAFRSGEGVILFPESSWLRKMTESSSSSGAFFLIGETTTWSSTSYAGS